jgi:signal transduction histidine kinase
MCRRLRFHFLWALFPAAVAASPLEWIHPELRRTRAELRIARDALAALDLPPIGQTVPQLGHQSLQVKEPPVSAPWVQIDLRRTAEFELVALVPAGVDYRTNTSGPYAFPRRFRLDAADDARFAQFRTIFTTGDADFAPPSVGPVVLRVPPGTQAQFLRLTVTTLPRENEWYSYALAEILVLNGNRNLALGAAVTSSSSATIRDRWHLSYLVDGRSPLGPPIRRARLPEFDAVFAAPSARSPTAWMAIDLGRTIAIDEVRLHPLHSWQGADVPGFQFPLRFRVEVADDPSFEGARPFHESGPEDLPNPGNNPVTIRGPRLAGRHVRVGCVKPASPTRSDFALSEIEVYSGDTKVSAGAAASTSDYPERTGPRPPALLTDGLTSLGELVELPVWLAIWESRHRTEREIARLEAALPDLERAASRRLTLGASGLGATVLLLGLGLVWRGKRRRAAEQRAFRAKLARDLHDEIGSNLAAIAVISESAALQPEAPPGDLREIHRIARESSDAMREVLWVIGAREEAGGNLADLLRQTASRMLPRLEVRWESLPEVLGADWPTGMRRHVFLVFKEALANIARHAHARRVTLRVRLGTDAVELEIADDGRGFDPASAHAGLGLRHMRERAAAIKGDCTIQSGPGGTTLRLRVPLPPPLT